MCICYITPCGTARCKRRHVKVLWRMDQFFFFFFFSFSFQLFLHRKFQLHPCAGPRISDLYILRHEIPTHRPPRTYLGGLFWGERYGKEKKPNQKSKSEKGTAKRKKEKKKRKRVFFFLYKKGSGRSKKKVKKKKKKKKKNI
jgi:hypothetical protein